MSVVKRKIRNWQFRMCGNNSVMVTADGDKAEVFNTFFASVFSQKEKDTQLGENEAENTREGINYRIDKEVVQQYLATLNEISKA